GSAKPWHDPVVSTKQGVSLKVSDSDERLLALLRENARCSTAELARRLGLSRTTVQSRIDRLEKQGVIGGYAVGMDDGYERDRIRAHILITGSPKRMAAVVKALAEMPEVRSLHSVSGAHDLVALGVAADVGAMDELTDRIGA